MSKILKEISCVTGEYKNAQGEVKKFLAEVDEKVQALKQKIGE